MARNVSNTISFEFKGIDNLSTVANTVASAVNSVAAAFRSMAGASKAVVGQGLGVRELMGSLQGVSAQIGASLLPASQAFSSVTTVAGQAAQRTADSMKTNAAAAQTLSTATMTAGKGVAEVGAKLSDATPKIKEQAGGLQELAGAYNALIVVKHASRLIAGGVKSAMDLEEAETNLSVATGVTGESLDRLKTAALKAAAQTVFKPTEALEGMKLLNLAVRDVDSTIKLAEPTMMLAQSRMGKNLPKAAKLAATMMGAFRMKSEDVEPALNKMSAMTRAAGVDINVMEGGMGKLGVAAAFVGASFEDILPAYLMSIKAGLRAEEAGTGLKTAMSRLGDPKIRAQLQAGLGVTVAQGGAFLTVRDIMVSLAMAAGTHGKNMTYFSNQMKLAFGDRASKAVMANITGMTKGILTQSGATLYGADAYDYMLREGAASGGMLQQQNELWMGTLSAKVEILTESLGLLVATAFAPLAQMLKPVADFFFSISEGLRSLAESSPVVTFLFSMITNTAGAFLFVIGPMLAVAGISRIAGVGLGFLNTTGIATSGVFVRMATRLGLYRTAATEAAVATNAVGAAANTAGLSIGKLWYKIFLPIGLVLSALQLVWPYLKKVWNWISGGGKASEAIASQKLEVVQAARVHTRSIRESESMLRLFSGALSEYTAALQTAKGIEQAKIPLMSGKVFGEMEKHYKLLDQSGKFSRPGLALMRKQLNDVNYVRDRYIQGLDIEDVSMVKAKKAMFGLNLLFQQIFPTEAPFLKLMSQGSTAFEATLESANASAMVLLQYGFEIPGLAEKNRAKYEDYQKNIELAKLETHFKIPGEIARTLMFNNAAEMMTAYRQSMEERQKAYTEAQKGAWEQRKADIVSGKVVEPGQVGWTDVMLHTATLGLFGKRDTAPLQPKIVEAPSIPFEEWARGVSGALRPVEGQGEGFMAAIRAELEDELALLASWKQARTTATEMLPTLDKVLGMLLPHFEPGGKPAPLLNIPPIIPPTALPTAPVTSLDKAALSMSDLTTQLKSGPLVNLQVTAPGTVTVTEKGGPGRSAVPAKVTKTAATPQ